MVITHCNIAKKYAEKLASGNGVQNGLFLFNPIPDNQPINSRNEVRIQSDQARFLRSYEREEYKI